MTFSVSEMVGNVRPDFTQTAQSLQAITGWVINPTNRVIWIKDRIEVKLTLIKDMFKKFSYLIEYNHLHAAQVCPAEQHHAPRPHHENHGY